MLLLVTFFTGRKFCKLLFTGKRGKFCYFLLFFTGCNFDKLLFTVEKGQGERFYSLCEGGNLKGCKLIFFLFILLLRGRGWKLMFFFPRCMKRWKEEGGKGYI